MAAAISALNAKIRSRPVLNYICSTHFWGPASNFGIPIAAIMDTQKDPEIISGKMTGALLLYSGTFMRYSMAVTPKNYLLFACHFLNFGAQVAQGWRWTQWWQFGGRDASLKTKALMEQGKGKMEAGLGAAKEEGRQIFKDGKEMGMQAKEKVMK